MYSVRFDLFIERESSDPNLHVIIYYNAMWQKISGDIYSHAIVCKQIDFIENKLELGNLK